MGMDFLMHYILDSDGNPIPEPDLLKWATWYKTSTEQRQIGNTHLGDIRVSTVFLSLPHVSKELGNNDMMLWETMVFASDAILARLMELSETDDRSVVAMFIGGVDIQKRYATKEEALRGHKAMCTFVEVCLTKGLLDEVLPEREE
jgi:hypothetical protein